MVDMDEVQAFAERVVAEFRPQRIILFGSYARGTATPDSDVDLLIVLPFEGKSWRRMARGDHFLQQVLHEGRTLYEARDN